MIKERNEVVVITGGSSGIGFGTAKYFAREGAKVIILSHEEDKNQKAVAEIRKEGHYADSFVCDVMDAKKMESTFQKIEQKYGFIDVLFANAGNSVKEHASIVNIKLDQYQNVMDCQLNGTVNAIKFAAPAMIKQRYGRIIVTASIAAHMGLASDIAYGASMSAKLGLVSTVAKELGPFGITVNAICPGLVRTEITSQMPEEGFQYIAGLTPTGNIGTVEDVAHTVAYLADPKAKWVNGINIKLDGGFTLTSPLEYEMYNLVNNEITQQFKEELAV